MKTLIFAVCAISVAASVFGDAPKPKMTPEEKEARKYRHFGGYIYQPQETKVVSIVNDQKLVEESVLSKIAKEMAAQLNFPVVVNGNEKVGLTLKVCECDKMGPLVVMPDSATAFVSVRKLSEDNPSAEVLETRISKELWRGMMYALGSGNTYVPQCVMKHVTSLQELDAIPSRSACPDAFSRANGGAAKLGIKPARRVTYRQACKEGWAPAPTNDVQKAVLERVLTEKGFEQQTKDPTNPIRIKYDPSKK